MATPHHDTTTVLVLELNDEGADTFVRLLDALTGDDRGAPLARYVVRGEGIDDVLAVTTGWTRNT